MKEHQAREYIFETKIKKLLEDSGYISIVDEKVLGRSGDHEIFAYGRVNMPTAFVYPVRIVCQYKYYAKNKVELNHIRDFGGIMADISERNYAIKKEGINIPDRYTDAGCYFSATAFARAAQEYAWAHNLFLISFERIEAIQPIFKRIEDFVSDLNENTINNITKDELLEGYDNYIGKLEEEDVQGIIGIINGVYPILMIGKKDWFEEAAIESQISETGRVVVEQAYRAENQFESKFDLTFKDGSAEFAVPNVVIEKLMQRNDNNNEDNIIFNIEIPYINKKGKKCFATMEVYLEGFSKIQYAYEQISLFR